MFDGFSTRLVEKLGYTAAFITGSGVSESRLGQVDVGRQLLDAVERALDDPATADRLGVVNSIFAIEYVGMIARWLSPSASVSVSSWRASKDTASGQATAPRTW